MSVGYYIFFGLIVIFSFISMLVRLYEISQSGKKELLFKMLKNNDISVTTFLKYKKDMESGK